MSKPPEDRPQQHQIRIEIDDAVADGIYANLAFITSNHSEFILDFARFLPGNTRGKVAARIIFSPVHAKTFLKSFTDAVDNYEKKFGQIKTDVPDKSIGFQINSDETLRDGKA